MSGSIQEEENWRTESTNRFNDELRLFARSSCMSTPVVLLCTTYVDDVSLLLENSKKQEGDYKKGSGVGSMTVGKM